MLLSIPATVTLGSGATYRFPNLHPPSRVTKLLAQFAAVRSGIAKLARKKLGGHTCARIDKPDATSNESRQLHGRRFRRKACRSIVQERISPISNLPVGRVDCFIPLEFSSQLHPVLE